MRNVELSHHIQKRIFNRLVGANEMRYSELKPKDIEGNLFMYHLHELIKLKLVEKIDKKYRLSESGKSLATRFSIRQSGIRIMPSTLSVIKLSEPNGKMLLYKRTRQPYINAVGFPSGKVHFGETLEESAYRELGEKCNYTNSEVKLTLRGEFSIVSKQTDFIENHVIGHVWEGTVSQELKSFDNHAGQTYWADWQTEDYNKFIPGFREIINACHQPGLFMLDLKL